MLISLCGPRGSGKDTIAEYLKDKYNFTILSWSTHLKDAVAAVFRWDRSMLEGNTPEDRNIRAFPDVWWENKLQWHDSEFFKNTKRRFTPEFVLQYAGTEMFRCMIHPDIWVYSLLREINPSKSNYVIKDTRFPNEIELTLPYDPLFIEVSRGSETKAYKEAKVINQGSLPNAPSGPYKGILPQTKMKLLSNIAQKHNTHVSELAWIGNPHIKCLIQNNMCKNHLYNEVDKVMLNKCLKKE